MNDARRDRGAGIGDRTEGGARSARRVLRSAAVVVALTIGAPLAAGAQSEPPNPQRNAYFGDLHVHTGLSFDAAAAGTDTLPEDAYRFAMGEEAIYRGRRVQRRVPLDFLAVTDHSEYMGMALMAPDPDGPLGDTDWPEVLAAGGPDAAARRARFGRSGFRGEDPITEFLTPELKSGVWERVIEAAEAFNQPGAFTTFVAYEWSPMPGGSHLHRNVIYRGPEYPDFPFSSVDSQRPEDLWAFIDAGRDAGMDAVLIPHNPNLSNGGTFAYTNSDGELIDRDYAEIRARNETLVEITQVKGTSETRAELSPNDMFAVFEPLDHWVGDERGALEGSYVRNAYGRGLEVAARTGLNPFAFGLVGAGDFHSSTSGQEEDNYTGALGSGDDLNDPERVLNEVSPILRAPLALISASGITGVWAEENTREALFDAFKRRETFATSGPRMQVRFFAGWSFAEGLVENTSDWLGVADAEGVPMGSDLSGTSADGAPLQFIVEAVKDPNGANLDRVQIVKVWYEDGQSFERVFDVVWSGERTRAADGGVPPIAGTVDVATASYTNDVGAPRLTAQWADPEFDAEQPAVYYARVIEIPTPRWTTYVAVENDLAPPAGVPATLQERAWTSPIFYTP